MLVLLNYVKTIYCFSKVFKNKNHIYVCTDLGKGKRMALLVSLLADEAIVLVIGVVLGVPAELIIKVHVQEGRAGGLLVVLEVPEHHLGPGEPLEGLVPVNVHASDPVVRPVLGVDDIEDTLNEVSFLGIQDVGQVGPGLVTELLGLEEVHVVAGEHVAVAVVVDPAKAILALRSGGPLHPVLHHEARGELVQQPGGGAGLETYGWKLLIRHNI